MPSRPLVLALLAGCVQSAPPGEALVIPATAADCAAEGLLTLDLLGADPSGPTEPSIIEVYVEDSDGDLMLARREVVERVDGVPVRSRVTHLAGGCAILEVETWHAPAHGVPIRREQRVLDPERAWMLSPYAPAPEDELTVWTLDAQGRPVLRERDVDVDGTIDVTEASTWDAAGRLIHRVTEVEHDGPSWTFNEQTQELTFAYDGAGNPILDERRYEYADIEHVSRTERTYDAHDQLTWERQSHDGAVSYEEHRTWTGPGRPLTRDVDRHGARTSATWTWRGDGSVEISSEESEHGHVWRAESEVLDAAGRRLRFEQDQPHDGFVDWIEENTWRPDGQQLTAVARYLRQGQPDAVHRDMAWAYDGAGRPTEALNRVDTTPSRTTWTYDGLDELISVHALATGRLLREQLLVRDAAGNLLLDAWDRDGDGADDQVSEWAYDADGRQFAALHDNDADGEVDWSMLSWFGAIAWE